MAYEDILYEKKEGVARLTLNRVKVFNAFRQQTLVEMEEALEDAAHDGKMGVIVVTGAGGKAFCSGGDITEMRDLTPESGRVFLLQFFKVLQLIRMAPKPVIAAVNGYCLGGGNEINLACDLSLASEKSLLGQVGPTVGSVPVLAGTQFLPRNVGDKRAKEIVFLCQRYTAEEARQMGWVNKVVPEEKFEEELQAWCQRLLEMSPQSLRIAKLSINFESDQLLSSFTHGIEILSGIYATEEFKEGMTAFLEKRKPDFNRFRK